MAKLVDVDEYEPEEAAEVWLEANSGHLDYLDKVNQKRSLISCKGLWKLFGEQPEAYLADQLSKAVPEFGS